MGRHSMNNWRSEVDVKYRVEEYYMDSNSYHYQLPSLHSVNLKHKTYLVAHHELLAFYICDNFATIIFKNNNPVECRV